ncbi:tetratricopeptide repeat protein [Massilia sp. UMI-21]|nr:tetratricopeptide repeat protein [Massilia sp. UMI-21]
MSDDDILALRNAAMQAAQREAETGNTEQARELYRAVLELHPGHAQAHFGLGLLEQQAGDVAAAIPHFALALQGAPDQESYWLGYIDALMSARQFATARELLELGRRHGLQGPAIEAAEQQLALSGAPAAQEIDAAAAMFAQGNIEAAGSAARALIERFPQHPFGWQLLGAVQFESGALAPALASMQKAVGYAPEDADALSNLGLVLRKAGRLDEAFASLRDAIALQPNHVHAHVQMAGALQEMGRVDEAHSSAKAALAIAPNHLEARKTLALILDNLGRPVEAVEQYRQVLKEHPEQTDVHSNMLLCMSYTDSITPEQLFLEHRQFGLQLATRVASASRWNNVPEPNRCLRIGVVSGDLRHHAVANFIEPVFKHLAGRPGLALHAYSNHPVHDGVTARLRQYVDAWRDVAALDDAALETLVRADGVDILVDLSGHTGHNRLPVLARKPAPLQATWIGYPGTTGLAAVDYLLTDRHMLPPGEYEHQFTEKLVRLPASLAFAPVADAPDIAALPALANGYLSFGSFNRLSKISRKVIALWASLLRALPDARLLLAGMPLGEQGPVQLKAWLHQEGIDAGRIRFHPRTGMRDYLALHNQVDICLDTFPYTGGTTTLHALHMGVPTLTLAGRTMAGRQTACLLGHHGLLQFIASDAGDYVGKAVALSRDPAALARVRSSLRSGPALWTPDAGMQVAEGLERAFRIMWERWCAGLPAVAFEVPPGPPADADAVSAASPPMPA